MIHRVISVKEINQFIKTLLESNALLKSIKVEGEISNFKRHSNGHAYFSLKDEYSRIACVMYQSDYAQTKIELYDGLQVVITGSVRVYDRMGQYQLGVRSVKIAGLGELYERYEALKKELKDLGYFDAKYKKSLPSFVRQVGIVTSIDGAALHDILSVMARKAPAVTCLVYPSLVQGVDASDNLIDGLRYFDEREDIDGIIIGRGGGSIEDLWSFNDRQLAEEIFKNRHPVVSAVGHETDFTIADFVADVRAPTPSVAAELVAESHVQLFNRLENQKQQLLNGIQGILEQKSHRMEILQKLLVGQKPEKKLIQRSLNLRDYAKTLINKMDQKQAMSERALTLATSKLVHLNPRSILEKGYLLAENDAGELLKSVSALTLGEGVHLIFHDGHAHAVVDKIGDKNEKL
jgi:exodeoxyribonuclease VII large subunit